MSSFVYDSAMTDVANDVINLATDTLKVMLVTSAYVASKADQFVSTASASEIVATNYAGGYGGAGRQALARTVVKDAVSHVTRVIFSGNLTWTTIGGVTNATVAAAVLIKELAGTDGSSKLVCYWQLATPFPTNGSNYVLTFDGTNGNIYFNL